MLRRMYAFFKDAQPVSDAMPPLPSFKGPASRPSLRRKYTIEEEHAGDYFFQEQRLKSVPDATQLEHLCNLSTSDSLYHVRNTGIICTLGGHLVGFLHS